jgi:hypothetical protein
MSEHPWSMPVSIHEVPETGRRFEIAADDSIRDSIARSAGLRALPRLEAEFDLVRRGSSGLRVTGRVSATVGQTCVVTLDPLENEIEEFIDLTFAQGAAAEAATKIGPVEVPIEDVPEPLTDDAVDLGAIATEFLLLGIDPYPRKPGVVFEPPAAEDDIGHPFAALSALKGRNNNER